MERDRSSESSNNLDQNEELETVQDKVDKMYQRLDKEHFARLSLFLMEVEDDDE